MKRIIASLGALLILLFATAATFAAGSVHIVVTSQGKKLTAQTCEASACSFVGVKPGDCTITLVDDKGNTVTGNYKLDLTWTVSAPRDQSTGMASGRSASATATTSTTTTTADHEVKAPRDIATGQSSGKRQHQPITITKEWGATSPQLRVSSPTGSDCDDVDAWSISINYTKIEMK